jgi:hypothetical protein
VARGDLGGVPLGDLSEPFDNLGVWSGDILGEIFGDSVNDSLAEPLAETLPLAEPLNMRSIDRNDALDALRSALNWR